MTVAIEAPPHGQRRDLTQERHAVDAAVAGRTTDAICDMNTVIEIDVAWRSVHAPPAQRPVVSEAPPHRISISALVQICEWQVMQVSVGGIPANRAFSTEV